MKYRVTFPVPVVYLPDHPRGRRDVRDLVVEAPDKERAIAHAIRVVSGDVSGLSVTPCPD